MEGGRVRERKWPDCSWLVLGGRGFCFEVEFGSRDCFIGCLHDMAKKQTHEQDNKHQPGTCREHVQAEVKGWWLMPCY
jgi:hypothetical protein